jgi:FkbM family methyltransferase
MLPVIKGIKTAVEQITGCRIYRNTLPNGTICSFDIEKTLGRNGVRILLDVGANIGQSAISYLREYPRAEIYSFEPVAATYEKLVANTRRFPRIHAYNLGFGPEACQTTIHVNPESQRSSLKLARPEDRPETITLSTIAAFAEEQKLQSVDFLKIDTEGFDLDVLAGAVPLLAQQRIHFVQCECEPVVRTREYASFSEVADFLTKYGYCAFGVYEQFREYGKQVLLYWNAVFVCGKLVPEGARWP